MSVVQGGCFNMRLRSLIPIILLLGGLGLVAGFARPAVADQAVQHDKPLRVATKPLEPFVIKQNDRWAGFSIDLWDKIAQQLGWKYEWAEVKTVTDQLAAVQSGGADVAMAGISITPEREAVVDFSHPYFNAGLQIMVPAGGDHSLLSTLRTVITPSLLQLLGIALLVTLVMAHLIWLMERSINPEFPRAYLPGVLEGLWYTIGSIGGNFVDEQPASVIRKLIQMAWVVIGIVLIAQFTASITTALTVQQLSSSISGPADLPGKSIATVRGSTAAKYLDAQHIAYVPVEKIDDAYDLLAQGNAQAVVYDAPVLLYYAATKGKGRVQMVGTIFKEETYGIALPTGSPLRKPINEALLKLKQDGSYEELYNKWFGSSK
jgi:polar amino acid transport system substrate-binding protein